MPSIPYLTPSQALTWTRVHEQSPTAVGIIDAWNAFHQLVPQGALLPATQHGRFESAFDNITTMRLSIAQRLAYHVPIPLAEVEMHGVKQGAQGQSRVHVTMVVERDLSGRVSAYDPDTKAVVETSFQLLDVKLNGELSIC